MTASPKAASAPDLSARFVRSENIVFTDLDDSIVMMDTEEGRYLELNPVGAKIWTLLETEPSLGDLCAALQAHYEVDSDVCLGEVRDFLTELEDLGVVRWRREGAETPAAPPSR